MAGNDRWLLPEGVEELLPDSAWRLEMLRRRVLDLFRGWGYDLVAPPLFEYLEPLLTGVGEDQELDTFKLIDQLSGRLLGVRADHTPQVARIDAHCLRAERPVRLCYLGPILRARPQGAGSSREPLQTGAELYGSSDPRADCEILELMVRMLESTGVPEPHLDLGHVGVFRALAAEAGLDTALEAELFEALQRKSSPDIAAAGRQGGLAEAWIECFTGLAALHGGAGVLDRARALVGGISDVAIDALDNLAEVATLVTHSMPDTPVYFDLAELRGYRYHTGIVFSAFAPGYGLAVAQGGRYDDIGAAFGHPRPATGFSADLRRLLPAERVGGEARGASDHGAAIAAPWPDRPALRERIAALRAGGERVIHMLPGDTTSCLRDICDRVLVERDDGWHIDEL